MGDCIDDDASHENHNFDTGNEPLSPGGEILREEERSKRVTKALKFNKAFDVAKVQSEVLR